MKALTTLFVIGMFATAVAMADDVDDVKAEMERYFAALNAGDAEGYAQHFVSQASTFVGGGLLNTATSLAEQRNGFQASVDAGLKRNMQLRHLDVRVYGNMTAVVTTYVIGSTTQPDGTVVPNRVQRTAVLIKQGGQWKEVHQHRSPLNIAPPQ